MQTRLMNPCISECDRVSALPDDSCSYGEDMDDGESSVYFFFFSSLWVGNTNGHSQCKGSTDSESMDRSPVAWAVCDSEYPRHWLSSANLLGVEPRTVQYYSMSMSTQTKVCGQEAHLLCLLLSRRQLARV